MATNPRFEQVLILACSIAATGCDGGSVPSEAGNPAGKSCEADMIDDFEDGEGFICESAGRHGEWYTGGDGTSVELTPRPGAPFTPTLIPGGRGTSRYAARLQGSGFSGWGAVMGFNLNKAPARRAYDASAADGIKFWMKSAGLVSVDFTIPSTIPSGQSAGTCVIEADCDNSFHFTMSESVDGWTEYEVPFTALRQPPRFGEEGVLKGAAVWDPSRVVSIQFAAQPPEFDVWVDDVSFYHCDADDCVPTCPGSEFPVACPASQAVAADCWPAGTDCSSPPDLAINTGVWGSSADDVWTVGLSTSGAGSILHWDGSSWRRSTLTTTPPLLDTWGSGASDVWAVGFNGAVLRWNGSLWAPSPTNTTSSLISSVWSTGPRDAWAAGAAGTVIHWDGSAWSTIPSGSTKELLGMWGSSADDVWAVGTQGAILHWDSAAWSTIASGTTSQLDSIWGSAAGNVWAVGGKGTILHWNGSAWSSVSSGTDAYLEGIWGSGVDDVWAVGESGTMLHWDGSAWSMVSSGTRQYLIDVWGSAADDVWAVGERGTILHFNGSAWTASR